MITDTIEIPQLLELSDPIEVHLLSPHGVLVSATTLDVPTASATFRFDHHPDQWWATVRTVFVPRGNPRSAWDLGQTFTVRHHDTLKITWLGGIT